MMGIGMTEEEKGKNSAAREREVFFGEGKRN
jgi:hypothetical protein